jgi:hypothetical protein
VKVRAMVWIWTWNQEMWDSKLAHGIVYYALIDIFLLSFQQLLRWYFLTGQDSFLLYPFQFIIHPSSRLSMLYNLSY